MCQNNSGGDFNAKSPAWGCLATDRSGRVLSEICDSTYLVLLQDNDSPPTYLHPSNGGLSRPTLANWNLFRAASDASLDSFDVQSGNINEVYGLFVKALLTAAKQAIPRTNGKRRYKPFWTSAVARIIRLRRATRRRHRRVKTDESRREYNRLMALAKELIAGATRDK